MPKKTFSLDIKLLALQYLAEGHHTIKEICQMFSINDVTLLQWRALYQFGGAEALTRSSKNKVYPEDLKEAAVKEYQSGTHSLFDIVAKYGCGLSVFKNWLKFYTSHSELKDSSRYINGCGSLNKMEKRLFKIVVVAQNRQESVYLKMNYV